MSKCLSQLLVVIMLISLSACSGGAERSRANLPQSTRLDRSIVAVASARSQANLALSTPSYDSAPGSDDEQPRHYTFTETSDGTIVFHLAHIVDPVHPLHLGLLHFKNEVETRSEGNLQVEIHPSATVGGDATLVSMVNDSQLDVAAITIWGVWHTLTEYANLESLPFMFTNYDEAWAAYEGALGDWVTRNIIEPHGAGVLGYWTNGLRNFTNNVRPIYMPSDLAGLRMRSPQIATNLAMYEEFGAASVSMAFDQLYDALEAGTVDGQDNPFGQIHGGRLFEVQRYLSISHHMFSCVPLIISIDFFNSLSEENKLILLESSAVSGRYQGELTRSMEEIQLQEMLAFGTQVNDINLASFMAAVEPIWEDHVERFGTEFISIASRYINDTNALAHRFKE